MTWLGKILAVLVMLLALVWVWLTAKVYVTRTNWKTEMERYKKGYGEAVAARDAEYTARITSGADYEKRITTLSQDVANLNQQLDLAKTELNTRRDAIALLEADKNRGNTLITVLQSNLQNSITELNTVREQLDRREKEVIDLVLSRERADTAKTDAEIRERVAKQRFEEADTRVAELINQLREAQRGGGAGRGGPLGRPTPDVPQNARGTVTRVVEGSLIEFSLGLDAGLAIGAVLDVYRQSDGGRYLGTVTVLSLEPKRAVGQFTPPSGARPRPEDLPRVGDEVGKVLR